MPKKRKNSKTRGQFISCCKKCDENFIKLFLWEDYWKNVQTLESELSNEKEQYEKFKETINVEVLSYKRLEKEQSQKFISCINQLKDKDGYKHRLNQEIENKKEKIDELNDTEQDNERCLQEIIAKKKEKEEAIQRIEIETKRLNQSNNEFLEMEASTRGEIKNLINSIYQKKNWRKEANIPLKSEILTGNVSKRKHVVYQSSLNKKKNDKFRIDGENCRCDIF